MPPRDVDSFLHLSRALALDAPLARALPDVNNAQYDLIERHVLACQPRCVAVLGLSFKPGTAVTTASPAFEFVRRLQARLIEIVVFDPISEARKRLSQPLDRQSHLAIPSMKAFEERT